MTGVPRSITTCIWIIFFPLLLQLKIESLKECSPTRACAHAVSAAQWIREGLGVGRYNPEFQSDAHVRTNLRMLLVIHFAGYIRRLHCHCSHKTEAIASFVISQRDLSSEQLVLDVLHARGDVAKVVEADVVELAVVEPDGGEPGSLGAWEDQHHVCSALWVVQL